jgi:hypothetical protein
MLEAVAEAGGGRVAPVAQGRWREHRWRGVKLLGKVVVAAAQGRSGAT